MFVSGYICGLFQTSYLYGKVHGIDIRNYGSGNAGATNALRTLGAKAGAITLLGDCFKCVIAVVIVHLIFGKLAVRGSFPLPHTFPTAGSSPDGFFQKSDVRSQPRSHI